MNFYGSVMLEHVKNDRKYFLALPLGVQYEEAHAAILEMASAVLEMQKQQAEAAAASEAEKAQSAQPVEVVEAEVVQPEITE